MTLRDELLPILDEVRGIPAELGLCDVAVALRVEDSIGGAFGTAGSTVTVTDTPLVPQPRVRRIGDLPSFHAAEAALTESQTLALYRVGPITPRSLAGTGYDLADLLPQNSTDARRVCLALSGAELGPDPVPFKIVPDGADLTALHLYVTVQQIQSLDT